MEHSLHVVLGENLVHAGFIFDSAEMPADPVIQVFGLGAQPLQDNVERILALLHQDQTARLQLDDLTAKLGTDRPARTGDHDGAPRDHRLDELAARRDRVPAQQVFRHDRADLAQRRLAGQDVVDVGNRAHGLLERLKAMQDLSALAGGYRRHGQHDRIGVNRTQDIHDITGCKH